MKAFESIHKNVTFYVRAETRSLERVTNGQTRQYYVVWALHCVHLQLYKDLKERQKSGQTKASLSLQQYLGFESGFTLDKESNTLAILCEDVVPVLAFDTREMLMQWRVKVQHNLGSSKEFAAVIISSPSVKPGPVRLHACGPRLALCGSRPPEVLALWDIKLLRMYAKDYLYVICMYSLTTHRIKAETPAA
ncbi:hypothetical protein KGM_201006A, partial [Danaus plexippus plexippus]